jgi:hypothetical protein
VKPWRNGMTLNLPQGGSTESRLPFAHRAAMRGVA